MGTNEGHVMYFLHNHNQCIVQGHRCDDSCVDKVIVHVLFSFVSSSFLYASTFLLECLL